MTSTSIRAVSERSPEQPIDTIKKLNKTQLDSLQDFQSVVKEHMASHAARNSRSGIERLIFQGKITQKTSFSPAFSEKSEQNSDEFNFLYYTDFILSCFIDFKEVLSEFEVRRMVLGSNGSFDETSFKKAYSKVCEVVYSDAS